MQLLKHIRLKGWKSIEEQTIDLQSLNVVIGANGAGKSNLISILKMLNWMSWSVPNLRGFVALEGGANSLLHFGSRRTPTAEIELLFQDGAAQYRYFAKLGATRTDKLAFLEERIGFAPDATSSMSDESLGVGHDESELIGRTEAGNAVATKILEMIRQCLVYHFHDTSDRSGLRNSCDLNANRRLHFNGGNVAAMLRHYRNAHPIAYRRMRAVARLAIPQFNDFVLEPGDNANSLLLRWTQTDSGDDYTFGSHQLSDGSLRLIALATLLDQPPESLPLLIALDEPELGLHPSAIGLLAAMAQSASQHCQLILATQSSVLLDHFDPSEVVVANNRNGSSEFVRLSNESFAEWQGDFELSDLWERNAIGGGPY